MQRPAAGRRRLRPSTAAAVGLGVLGGSLIGVGALGFDKAPVEAASCAPPSAAPAASPAASPDPTPAPAATPGSSSTDPGLVTGQPVSASTMAADEAALAGAETPAFSTRTISDVHAASLEASAVEAGPLGRDTTTAPTIGARKPACELPPTEVIDLPGNDGDADSEDPDSDVPADETDGHPDGTATGPTPVPVTSPVPTPRPAATPRPVSPKPTTNPSIPAPSTTTRGYSTSSPPRTPTPGRTGTITRPEVIARAVSWVTQQVPYSQVRWWTDLNGTFRQDCSGYVSMVWRTDQRTNYWTGNLGTVADRIPSSTMQPGDILLLPGKHTLIFLGWANSSKTRFHLFEEYRTGTPARFVKNASLSYYLDRGYGAYRYDGIRDVAAAVVEPIATPAPTPIAPEADAATPTPEPRQETVALLSAESTRSGVAATPATLTWTLQRTVADLPATDWTPGVAQDYTPENDNLTLVAPDADASEVALAATPVDELVAAQSAVDRAEEQRIAALTSNALITTRSSGSGAAYVLAGGLGLLFVAIPLGAASRRTWTAASSAAPVDPGRKQG